MNPSSTTGSCRCGQVAYRVEQPLRPVWNCYCEDCRKITGNFMAATGAAQDAIVIEPADTLVWYSRQPGVFYGFCSACGSTLFWRADDKPGHMSIAAGTLNTDPGLAVDGVLFTDDKPSWAGDVAASVPHFAADHPTT